MIALDKIYNDFNMVEDLSMTQKTPKIIISWDGELSAFFDDLSGTLKYEAHRRIRS
jgi:hypothetical protein